MTSEELKLLAEIYSDPELVTPEEINNELEDLGFDYDEFRLRVLNRIMDIKREAKYDEGRQNINKYYSLLSELKDKLHFSGSDKQLESQIRFAFHKLEGISDEDLKEIMNDQAKMKLIKEIKDKKEIDE